MKMPIRTTRDHAGPGPRRSGTRRRRWRWNPVQTGRSWLASNLCDRAALRVAAGLPAAAQRLVQGNRAHIDRSLAFRQRIFRRQLHALGIQQFEESGLDMSEELAARAVADGVGVMIEDKLA